jgi:anaerobic magnesium-protoporphyrin IX monomethyl ester cyclase
MSEVILITTSKQLGYVSVGSHPIGLMYIASYLRDLDRHNVRIIDQKIKALSESDLTTKLKKYQPKFIGITGMTYELDAICALASMIKKTLPKVHIIIGGCHATSSPEDFIKFDFIDYVICGEGEISFSELIKSINHGFLYPKISGLAYKKNGHIIYNKIESPSISLDKLPFPAWDLIDIDAYSKTKRPLLNYKQKKFMTIYSSRGCPFHCIYCHSIFGKKLRSRSAENIFKEIMILYSKYQIKEFLFADDAFNMNVSIAEKLMDYIIDSGIKIHISFACGLRGDYMTTKLLDKMKAAGTFYITYAVETASPRLQKLIKKNLNLEKLTTIINETVKRGIFTRGCFMFGFPTETKKELYNTIKYALNSKFHAANFFIVTPYPGTELFYNIKDKLSDSHLNSIYHYRKSDGYGLSNINRKDFSKIVRNSKIKFLIQPIRLYRYFMIIPKTDFIYKSYLVFIRYCQILLNRSIDKKRNA